MDKRQQIKEWFEAPKPNFPTGSFIIGIILGIVGIIVIASVAVLGIILFLGGVGMAIFPYMSYSKAKKRFEARPSDQQMDQWFFEDIQPIIDKNALDKLGVDKSELIAESLVVPGPVFWSIPGFNSSEILRRTGNDGFNRYTVWTLQVFIFTENFLGSYKCNYNWIRNTCINESTNEFFYKDVVSVKTDSVSSAYTLLDNQKMEHAQAFQLNLPGDRVTVVIDHASLKTSSEMTSRVDKAVQSIRTMIRQKKS